jgi:anti-sigma regulatory factor (Ser/Thr protein kinase)
MSTLASESSEAPDATSKPAVFRHDALLYAGELQFVTQTSAFVRDALEREEAILVAVIEPRQSLLRDALGDDAKHVEFFDMWHVGRNPARIIPAWQRWSERNARAGRPFRGIGEPIWAARDPQALLECQIHEQLLNTAFDHGPAWRLLCPYDTEALPESVIARAHDTHPSVVDSGGHQYSKSYPHPELTFSAMFGGVLPEPDPARIIYQTAFGVDDIPAIRATLTSHAWTLGLTDQSATDLVLVVNELATNSVRHGGGRGTLRVWRDQDGVVCEVRDRGLVVDPLIGRRRPDPAADGGAGLWLANQICDLVQIRSTAEAGTTVRVRMQPGRPQDN